MTGTATRLITLLMLLQRRPQQKAADLADRLGVSVRTVHRYISMLDDMGIPVYAERGPSGGFSLVRGYKMPPLIFHPEEAVAVYLGTKLVAEMWGDLYRAAAAGALAKLDNVLPDEQRREIAWAQRTFQTTGLHRPDRKSVQSWLEKLRRSARHRCRTHVVYRSPNRPDSTERDFDPYALVLRWGWWYAVGFCHLRQAIRSFRIDRILDLTVLEKQFEPLPDFDLQDYLASEFETQPQISSRLRFLPEASAIVHESGYLWDTTETNTDGSLDVTIRSPDLRWLASLALSFGPLVEVIEPLELRHQVRDWAAATAAIHTAEKD